MKIDSIYSWFTESNWFKSFSCIYEALLNLASRIRSLFFRTLFRDDSKAREKAWKQEYQNVKREVADLQSKIALFDNYILNHQDLKEIFIKYLQEYGQYIAQIEKQPYEPSDTDSSIDRWGKLKHVEIELEHWWTERIRFVQSHRSIKNCMIKHANELLRKETPTEIERKVINLIPYFKET